MRTKKKVKPQGMLQIGDGITKSRKTSLSSLSLVSAEKCSIFLLSQKQPFHSLTLFLLGGGGGGGWNPPRAVFLALSLLDFLLKLVTFFMVSGSSKMTVLKKNIFLVSDFRNGISNY